MLTFKRDTAESPAPSTWDYYTHEEPPIGQPRDHTVALCTCPYGHTCRLSGAVHTIIENESGRLSPSYVCPVAGCTFHDWVRLKGWSWSWYALNCAPDRFSEIR